MKFSETQIGFEIPRILATSDVALRLLHTRYDHVTPLYPNTITKEDHVPTAVKHFKEEEHTEKAVTEDKVFAEENTGNQAAESQSRQETELSFVQEEEPNTEALENIDVRKVGCCLSVCLSEVVSRNTFQARQSKLTAVPCLSLSSAEVAGLRHSSGRRVLNRFCVFFALCSEQ